MLTGPASKHSRGQAGVSTCRHGGTRAGGCRVRTSGLVNHCGRAAHGKDAPDLSDHKADIIIMEDVSSPHLQNIKAEARADVKYIGEHSTSGLTSTMEASWRLS